MKPQKFMKKSCSIILILFMLLSQSVNAFAAEMNEGINNYDEFIADNEPEEESEENSMSAEESKEQNTSITEQLNKTMEENLQNISDVSENGEDALLLHSETSNEMVGGYVPSDLDKDTPIYDSESLLFADIPAEYSTDLSQYPDNRNQNPYGTCWAFSTLGLAEFNLINKGDADKSIDLSELQLIYFTFNSSLDPLGGTNGDQSKFYNVNGYNFLNYGGNYENAVRRLAQWSGVTRESDVPYNQAGSIIDSGLADEYAYQYDAFLLKNAYIMNIRENTDTVKTAILEYGAVGVMYFHNDQSMLWNNEKNIWTYYDTDYSGGGHAVMVIGWDDNFSRDNFGGVQKPSKDGAWLIRNSWGNYVDYFWMSYESTSLSTAAWALDFDSRNEYDNNYQLDGGLDTYYDLYYTNEANVFKVQNKEGVAAETLKSVQLSFTHQASVGYRIEVYTDLKNPKNPLSGTKQEQATTEGQTAYAGIYTIDLENTVTLMPGSYFSIVISTDKNALDYEQGISYADGETMIWSCPAVSHGDSFCSTDGKNYSIWSMGNYCIKAFTSNMQGSTPIIPEKPENNLDDLAENHKNDVADGIYFIRSVVNQNFVLDVSGNSKDNMANVQISEENGTDTQRWKITHDEKGYLTFFNVESGKVLDVSSARTVNGTNIQQYISNNSNAQKWIGVKQSDGSITFLSALDAKKCVDLELGTAVNAANIQLYETNGSKAQCWILSQKTIADELANNHQKDITDGIYFIRSAVNQNFVLDVFGGSKNNNANVQVYEKNDTDAQKWKITHDEMGYLTLANIGSGKILDVASANTANGTNIQQYVSNNSKAQKWIGIKQSDGSITFLSAMDVRKCVDLELGTAVNAANIQLYETNGSKAQCWILSQKTIIDELASDHHMDVADGTYTIQSVVNNNYVLDVFGGSKDNSANVQVYRSNETNAQKWIVSHDSAGYLTITNVGSKKVLDVNTASTVNGTNIQQYESNKTMAQKWIGVKQSDGSVVLLSVLNQNKCVDLNSAVATNGSNIQLYDFNGTTAQRWIFKKIVQ